MTRSTRPLLHRGALDTVGYHNEPGVGMVFLDLATPRFNFHLSTTSGGEDGQATLVVLAIHSGFEFQKAVRRSMSLSEVGSRDYMSRDHDLIRGGGGGGVS